MPSSSAEGIICGSELRVFHKEIMRKNRTSIQVTIQYWSTNRPLRAESWYKNYSECWILSHALQGRFPSGYRSCIPGTLSSNVNMAWKQEKTGEWGQSVIRPLGFGGNGDQHPVPLVLVISGLMPPMLSDAKNSCTYHGKYRTFFTIQDASRFYSQYAPQNRHSSIWNKFTASIYCNSMGISRGPSHRGLTSCYVINLPYDYGFFLNYPTWFDDFCRFSRILIRYPYSE